MGVIVEEGVEKPAEPIPPSRASSNVEDKRRHLESSILFMGPKALLSALLLYAGLGIMWFGTISQRYSFIDMIDRYGATAVGVILASVGVIIFYDEFLKKRRERFERFERFVDVDARLRSDSIQERAARSQVNAVIEEKDYGAVSAPLQPSARAEIAAEVRDFVNYFDSIRGLLEKRSAGADEKASILLDKGTAYSKFGIVFFIISIISWQAISLITGFKEQYVYGIVSCSVLFIFVEFLSAWFLKQYRQFIDTSTYLIKVKSIFDRYMMVYLVVKEAGGAAGGKSTSQLIEILRADIKWPDTYLMKGGDVSFAKEAIETMTMFMKNMRSELKAVSSDGGKAQH